VYGSPLGLGNTVSDGIVSAIRDIPDFGKVIQITAPISPGSSGSPVLNMNGEVIGIAFFQMIEGQNLNFAIPSEKITSLILTKEKKTFATEELFGQDNKTKKDSEYDQACEKALYFIEKKEYEKALPYLEIMIKTEISPSKEYLYLAIGNCNNELGNYTKAIEAYKQAIRINPDNVYSHLGLGLAYLLIGDKNSALNEYKILKELDIDKANQLFDFIY
jgi:tetratricopeptide (TPR) repeat protein